MDRQNNFYFQHIWNVLQCATEERHLLNSKGWIDVNWNVMNGIVCECSSDDFCYFHPGNERPCVSTKHAHTNPCFSVGVPETSLVVGVSYSLWENIFVLVVFSLILVVVTDRFNQTILLKDWSYCGVNVRYKISCL